ncbi:uncharacterized protein LOC130738276 [Lotus japonicus]|uniref:uncharacterized protein LOC130738276 n=1 Tax=Lotus japonicus TaxID=34305 RepID=UPI0025847D12|nr:uncharacterized protein LOC130738276 [Lotus japonicus]
MAMNIDYFSSITLAKVNWCLKLKIVRQWRLMHRGFPKSIEMVVMDEHGDKIHSSICRDHFLRFYLTLIPGFTYIMRNFTVRENSEYFPSTSYLFELHFRVDTFFHQVNDFPIIRSPYSFVRIPDVLNLDVSYDYLIDVIGVQTKIGRVQEFTVSGNVEKLVRFDISVAGTKIECVLIAQFVDEYIDFISTGRAFGAVVLIQLGRVKTCPCTANRYIAA